MSTDRDLSIRLLERLLDRAREESFSDPSLIAGWLPPEPAVRHWLQRTAGLTDAQWHRFEMQAAEPHLRFTERLTKFGRQAGIDQPGRLASLVRCSRGLSALLQTQQGRPILLEPEASPMQTQANRTWRVEQDLVLIAARTAPPLDLAVSSASRMTDKLRYTLSSERSAMHRLLGLAHLAIPSALGPRRLGRWLKYGHAESWPLGIVNMTPLTSQALEKFLDATGISLKTPAKVALTHRQAALLVAKGQGLLFLDASLPPSKQRWILAQALGRLIELRARREFDGTWAGFLNAGKEGLVDAGNDSAMAIALWIAVPAMELRKLLGSLENAAPQNARTRRALVSAWTLDVSERLEIPRWVAEARTQVR